MYVNMYLCMIECMQNRSNVTVTRYDQAGRCHVHLLPMAAYAHARTHAQYGWLAVLERLIIYRFDIIMSSVMAHTAKDAQGKNNIPVMIYTRHAANQENRVSLLLCSKTKITHHR
jgi:hypothetical protein